MLAEVIMKENTNLTTVPTLQPSEFKDKQSLCNFIATLQQQVNELALTLSVADGPELHEIWLNLANARAYLNTALETARGLKHPQIVYYHI